VTAAITTNNGLVAAGWLALSIQVPGGRLGGGHDALTAPYSAPTAGPPPWHLYRFTFHTVVGLSTTEPDGATHCRFGQ
jgi:hypothetical protein